MVNNSLVASSQFKRGMEAENYLDQYFGTQFEITRTTSYQERSLCLGDRIYKNAAGSFFVEYKSDTRAHVTGNVFFETISVDNPCKPGWVYTCQSDYILYAILLSKTILIFKPPVLRKNIAEMKAKFREGAASKDQGEDYKTYGVIVPLHYAKTLAAKIILLNEVPSITL